MSDIIYYNTGGYVASKCSGYGIGYLIKDMKSPVGVEIGLAEGFTTEHLLSMNPNLTLYCIDPYVDYVDWNKNNLNDRENVFLEFKRRTEKFGERVKLLRMTSDDAVSHIEDDSLDFIFIDGLHTFDQVTKDMNNYYSKVKKGGIFSGHDYNVIHDVNRAVNIFASQNSKDILQTDCDVWYWYK